MTRYLLFLAVLFSACKQPGSTNNRDKTDTITKALPVSSDSTKQTRIEKLKRQYYIGDVNNDKKADTAFIEQDKIIRDGTIEKECPDKNCRVVIKFNNNIPDLVIDGTLGIIVKQGDDYNSDKANEMILFSEWFEGYWQYLTVWTLKSGEWESVAITRAFVAEDKDFENRIIKIKSHYYLLGDDWNDSKGGVIERSLKIKI